MSTLFYLFDCIDHRCGQLSKVLDCVNGEPVTVGSCESNLVIFSIENYIISSHIYGSNNVLSRTPIVKHTYAPHFIISIWLEHVVHRLPINSCPVKVHNHYREGFIKFSQIIIGNLVSCFDVTWILSNCSLTHVLLVFTYLPKCIPELMVHVLLQIRKSCARINNTFSHFVVVCYI